MYLKYRVLTQKRQYGEIELPLQAILEVMKHFDNYINIPQIRQLADQVYTHSVLEINKTILYTNVLTSLV